MTSRRQAQADLSPAQALRLLQEGNERFVSGAMQPRDLMQQVRQTAGGQYPFSAVLGCIDSRVPPELVFDQGIGDLFAPRIAGNFINTDILGSLEFATAVAGAKLVVVLGHTSCGAIEGACQRVELGHLTQTLANLAPAIEAAGGSGEDRADKTFLDAVSLKNVELTVDAIPRRSPVMANLVVQGNLAIVGALHDVETGRVRFLTD